MEERAPVRFFGCGLNTFWQLGPLAKEDEAGAAEGLPPGASPPPQPQHHVVRLPWRLALERCVEEEEDGPLEQVACGSTFTVAVSARGAPYQWGTLNGRAFPEPTRVPLGVPLRCMQVACGRKHVLALMEGGFVMSWGVGYFGQLGHGDDLSCDRPRMIHHLDPQRLGDQVVQVACGGLHSAVSTAGQSVLCFGFNRYGQLGQGSTSNKISTPRPVNMQGLGAARIRQLACGRHHTSVLTDKGHVYSWGASSFGRLGLPDPKKVVPLPNEVAFFRTCPLRALACGDFHVLGLGVDGRVYSWGYGAEGQGGLGATLHLRTPRQVEGLEGHTVTQIACGAWWSLVLSAEGQLFAWGYGDGGWLGLDPGPTPLPYVEPCPPVTKFGATCSFDSDFNACLPQQVASLRHMVVERVAAGGAHTIIMARKVQRRFGPGGSRTPSEDWMQVEAADGDGGDVGTGMTEARLRPPPPSPSAAAAAAAASALAQEVGAMSLGGSVDDTSSSNGSTSHSSSSAS